MRSASKPPEATIRTCPCPASSSAARTARASGTFTPVGAESPRSCASPWSTSRSEVSSRTPHRSPPSASATATAVAAEVLAKSTSTVTFIRLA